MGKIENKKPREVYDFLQNGGRVYCHFKQGEKYRVHSVSGVDAFAWVILAIVGPINYHSRRIEGWELIEMSQIHESKD